LGRNRGKGPGNPEAEALAVAVISGESGSQSADGRHDQQRISCHAEDTPVSSPVKSTIGVSTLVLI
jgi:hypothetical protein